MGGSPARRRAEACPDQFHCAADSRCWRNGGEPDLPSVGNFDLGMSHPDLSQPLAVDRGGPRPGGRRPRASRPGDGADGSVARRSRRQSVALRGPGREAVRKFRGAAEPHPLGQERRAQRHHHRRLDPSLSRRLVAAPQDLGQATADQDPQANLATYRRKGSPSPAPSICAHGRSWRRALRPRSIKLLNFSNPSGTSLSFTAEDGSLRRSKTTRSARPPNRRCGRFPRDSGPVYSLKCRRTAAAAFACSSTAPRPPTSRRAAPAFRRSITCTWAWTGWEIRPNLPATEMWLDEIILDDKPTTCAE